MNGVGFGFCAGVVYQLLDYIEKAVHWALQRIYTLLYKDWQFIFLKQKKYDQSHSFTISTILYYTSLYVIFFITISPLKELDEGENMDFLEGCYSYPWEASGTKLEC